jgi:hypothetical protein
VHAAITAATGFLVAVLWFDLMFDVQVWPYRHSEVVPADVTDSIATYYRRVTTDAHPMSRLISLVMACLLGLLIWQAVRADTPVWLSVVSLAAAVAAIGLALGRVVPDAVRLGSKVDHVVGRSRLARRIFRDHVLFLTLMSGLLVLQLVAG